MPSGDFMPSDRVGEDGPSGGSVIVSGFRRSAALGQSASRIKPHIISKFGTICGDVLALGVMPAIVFGMTGSDSLLQIISFGLGVTLAFTMICAIIGAYPYDFHGSGARRFSNMALAWVTSSCLVIIIWFATRQPGTILSWQFVITFMGSGVVGLTLFRASLALRYRRMGSGRTRGKRVAIVGSSADVWIMRVALKEAERAGQIAMVGTVELPLGDVDPGSIVAKVTELMPDWVIVTERRDESPFARTVLDMISNQPVDVFVPIDAMTVGSTDRTRLGDVSLARLRANPLRGWRGGAKRGMDLLLALMILILALPLMGVIAAMIRWDSPGPALIRQRRFGYASRPIQVFKFRTMHWDKGDLSGARATRRNDPRVTGLGRLLRATSLDELPQLFNVLQGTMSLVGPRPHPIEMQVCGVPYYDAVPGYLSRHRVKPGITGLAQISGCRGSVETMDQAEKRLNYDLEYINTWSPMLDLRILWRTVFKGFVGERAY